MAEEDIDAMVAREVKAAREILREDRLTKSHQELRDRFDKQFPERTDPDESDKPGTPPKKTEPDQSSATTKKPGIWWGKRYNGGGGATDEE